MSRDERNDGEEADEVGHGHGTGGPAERGRGRDAGAWRPGAARRPGRIRERDSAVREIDSPIPAVYYRASFRPPCMPTLAAHAATMTVPAHGRQADASPEAAPRPRRTGPGVRPGRPAA